MPHIDLARWSLLVLLAVPLPAQNDTTTAPTRAALAEAERALGAALSRDGLAVTLTPRTTTPGFTLVWPGAAVVHGADRLPAFFAGAAPIASLRLGWAPLRVAVDSASGTGVAVGVLVGRGATVDEAPLGRYLAAWRHSEGRWRLEALAVTGIGAALEVRWRDGMGPTTHAPLAAATGPWVDADLRFAAEAGRRGAAEAFREWAAPDGVMFGPTGELRFGPQEIHAGFDPRSTAQWRWAPVATGGSPTGPLGWTVGEAVIRVTGPDGTTTDYTSKYLTLWRRFADGRVRFLADGGSDRP